MALFFFVKNEVALYRETVFLRLCPEQEAGQLRPSEKDAAGLSISVYAQFHTGLFSLEI